MNFQKSLTPAVLAWLSQLNEPNKFIPWNTTCPVKCGNYYTGSLFHWDPSNSRAEALKYFSYAMRSAPCAMRFTCTPPTSNLQQFFALRLTPWLLTMENVRSKMQNVKWKKMYSLRRKYSYGKMEVTNLPNVVTIKRRMEESAIL